MRFSDLGSALVGLCVGLILVSEPARADILHPVQVLQPEGLEEGADFGFSVAVARDWLFAGEPGRFSDYGGVKNFRWVDDTWSPNGWNFDPDARFSGQNARNGQAISLEATDGSFYLTIGQARSYIAVTTDPPARASSYYYDGEAWDWSLPDATGPADGQPTEDFASSVAVSGSGQSPTVVIGAPLRPGVTVLSLDGGSEQNPAVQGNISSLPMGVAIEGDRAAVGHGNRVIILERAEGETEFEEIHTLEAPEGASRFGFSLKLRNDLLLVGSPYSDVNEVDRGGKVYVYDLAQIAEPQMVLELADPVSYDHLGWSVDWGEDFIVASAPGGEGGQGGLWRDGRVAVFDLETGALRHELEVEVPSVDDFFGKAVAANGSYVVSVDGAPWFESAETFTCDLDEARFLELLRLVIRPSPPAQPGQT